MARKNRELMEIMGEPEFERFFRSLDSYARSLVKRTSAKKRPPFQSPFTGETER